MIVIPTSSDILGRRITAILAFLTGALGFTMLISGIKLNINILMIIGSMIAGIFGSGITILGFILTCDFLTEKSRQRYFLIYCSMWGIA